MEDFNTSQPAWRFREGDYFQTDVEGHVEHNPPTALAVVHLVRRDDTDRIPLR